MNFGVISICIDEYTQEQINSICNILDSSKNIKYKIIKDIIHVYVYDSSTIGIILTLIDRYINTGKIISLSKIVEDDSLLEDIKTNKSGKKLYDIWNKIDTDISKLNEDELYWLTEILNTNLHSVDGTIVSGSFLFDFRPILNKYSFEFKSLGRINSIKIIVAPSEAIAKRFITSWHNVTKIINVIKLEI